MCYIISLDALPYAVNYVIKCMSVVFPRQTNIKCNYMIFIQYTKYTFTLWIYLTFFTFAPPSFSRMFWFSCLFSLKKTAVELIALVTPMHLNNDFVNLVHICVPNTDTVHTCVFLMLLSLKDVTYSRQLR